MASAVEKFLAQKRAEQQKSFSPQINSIAPPIHERYGIKPSMSGEYTGKGADGVTQATMPTQKRIDSNGKPYIVDENEMLVVDSKTLNDYGGPEALDKFIQTNRPGRQFACGGVPTKDRYFTGGIPSNRQAENTQTMPIRPRAISSDQMRLLGEIRDGARRFQEGGTPASSDNPDLNNYFNKQKGQGNPFGQINKPIDKKDPVIQKIDPIIQKTDPINFNQTLPIKQNLDPSLNNQLLINQGFSFQTPIKQNLDPSLNNQLLINQPFSFPTPIKQNLDPINFNQTLPDVGGDVSLGGTGAKSFSPKDIDEMMFQRQMARMGSQQESERAAEAQRGLQAGLSEREVQGQGAISDVGRREAQAGATADFAINQAQRLDEQEKENKAAQERQREFDEGTRRFNVQTGQWEKQFGEDKYRFNVQTGQWEKTFEQGVKQTDIQNKQWDLQFNTGKQKDSLNAMIAAGDYKGAAKLFKDIYGSNIDFSYLEDSKKASQWSEGFNNMISLISSGTKWEDALKIMKADGSLKKMGMNETDLYNFYAQAQLNNDPLYKYINTVDGWVRNGLIKQDDADDMIALFKYNLTNPNGLEVVDGYSVKDKNGKEVGFFTTKEEADKYVTDNKDKGYVSDGKLIKNHVRVKGSSNNVVNDNNNDNNSNNNLTDLQAHSNFIDSLPSDAPSNVTEWLDVEMWKTAGKPKDYAALKTWMGDTNKVTSYLKPKYPTMNLDIMSSQDRTLVLESIKNGNTDLMEKFRYSTDVGDEKNRADRMTELFSKYNDYFTLDDRGNIWVYGIVESNLEKMILQPGKIIELPGKNGKQNFYINSLRQEKTKEHGSNVYWYYYDVVDVKTGLKSQIIFKGLGGM